MDLKGIMVKKGLPFDGKSDYIEVDGEHLILHIEFLPETLKQLLNKLPRNRWYAIMWDSDGDFLITNAKNRKILPDLFCKLKKEVRNE